MSQDGDHFLSEEFCFFDGKVKRVKSFTSLTASIYHPMLRKQKILATMECKGENSQNVAEFWALFNQALADFTGKPCIFNPRGWSSDNGGAVAGGIKEVFGGAGLAKLKTCEFHFKDSVNKHANHLGDNESKERFKVLALELLESLSVPAYNQVKDNLEAFIEEDATRASLSNWLNWWHMRRHFIFKTFCPDGPRMNQAEVVHASWVNGGDSQLSLLRAAREDVKDNELLIAECSLYLKGACKEGTGPSFHQLQERNKRREIEAANRFGNELISERIIGNDPANYQQSEYYVDAYSSYKPPPHSRIANKEKVLRKRGRSKEFTASLAQANDEKNSLKVKTYGLDPNGIKAVVMKSDGNGYEIEINTSPSCFCPFFTKRVSSRICKHLIWFYINALQIKDESDLIQQVRHTSDTLKALLSTASASLSEVPAALQ